VGEKVPLPPSLERLPEFQSEEPRRANRKNTSENPGRRDHGFAPLPVASNDNASEEMQTTCQPGNHLPSRFANLCHALAYGGLPNSCGERRGPPVSQFEMRFAILDGLLSRRHELTKPVRFVFDALRLDLVDWPRCGRIPPEGPWFEALLRDEEPEDDG
jgi:hypothetical protein